LKATAVRLTREHARELLGKLDSVITSANGRAALEAAVKALNSSVPTY